MRTDNFERPTLLTATVGVAVNYVNDFFAVYGTPDIPLPGFFYR